MEPTITEDARKHGVADEDMLHAWRQPLDAFELEDGGVMLIGGDRAGNLIEVGVRQTADGAVIFHAYRPARPKFLR